MYMYTTPAGTFAETQIDANYLAACQAGGTITTRVATYAEELAECYRLRETTYPPLSQLADATYHQAQGDSSQMQAYIAAIAAVKARYPKPTAPSS